MATVYLKDGIWWLAWGSGKNRVQKSTGLVLEKKSEALKIEANIEREQEARAKLLAAPLRADGRTFRAFSEFFLKHRERREKSSWKKERNWLRHVMPHLGTVAMDEIDTLHIEEAVLKLRKTHLAPRSVRHIGGVLSLVFKLAMRERIIRANPYELEVGVLPAKKDKNPRWRPTAVFTHEEVELLITSPLIPEDRRVFYAIVFLAGCRLGEVSDRRWQDWDESRKPLGALIVHSSYSSEEKRSKSTKTDVVREIPVHLALKGILAAFRDGGGAERLLGRKPEADDLMVPREDDGTQRTSSVVWKRLAQDFKTLEMRHRRLHDGRRTFLSLGVADGAEEYRLKKLTHPTPKDAADGYVTIPWRTFCEDVSRLRIQGLAIATPELRTPQANEVNHG